MPRVKGGWEMVKLKDRLGMVLVVLALLACVPLAGALAAEGGAAKSGYYTPPLAEILKQVKALPTYKTDAATKTAQFSYAVISAMDCSILNEFKLTAGDADLPEAYVLAIGGEPAVVMAKDGNTPVVNAKSLEALKKGPVRIIGLTAEQEVLRTVTDKAGPKIGSLPVGKKVETSKVSGHLYSILLTPADAAGLEQGAAFVSAMGAGMPQGTVELDDKGEVKLFADYSPGAYLAAAQKDDTKAFISYQRIEKLWPEAPQVAEARDIYIGSLVKRADGEVERGNYAQAVYELKTALSVGADYSKKDEIAARIAQLDEVQAQVDAKWAEVEPLIAGLPRFKADKEIMGVTTTVANGTPLWRAKVVDGLAGLGNRAYILAANGKPAVKKGKSNAPSVNKEFVDEMKRQDQPLQIVGAWKDATDTVIYSIILPAGSDRPDSFKADAYFVVGDEKGWTCFFKDFNPPALSSKAK